MRKKNKARLQKMYYAFPYTDPVEVTCLVDLSSRGGEFTLCGNAIPDSNLDYEEFTAIGEKYEGSIKEVTCPDCLRTIEYIKSLK